MLDRTDDISIATENWLAQFESALAEPDGTALSALFHPDSHWRDVLALSWNIQTVNGVDAILSELRAHAHGAVPGNFSFITEYPLPINTNAFVTNQPYGLLSAQDGNIWFADYGGSSIGRMTTSGVVTKFFTPTTNSFPSFLATGADSNIWFGEIIASSPGFTHNIARFSFATVTPQRLSITPDTNFQNVTLSWTNSGTNFQLQLNNDLTTTNWVNVTNVPVVVGGMLTVTNAISGNAFYRLLQ